MVLRMLRMRDIGVYWYLPNDLCTREWHSQKNDIKCLHTGKARPEIHASTRAKQSDVSMSVVKCGDNGEVFLPFGAAEYVGLGCAFLPPCLRELSCCCMPAPRGRV